MKKPFLFLLLILSIPLFGRVPAYAQNISLPAKATLKVTPVIIPLQLLPNQTISKDIVLENPTDNPAPLRANFTDFETTGEDGGYSFPQTATNPLLSWATITPEEVIIPAHSKKTVTLTIKIPNKVPVGGYFGMLFFEPVLNATDQQATQVIARVGILLLGSVGVQDANTRPLSLETLSIPFLVNDTTVPLLLRAKNTGLQYLTAKPIITLSPVVGSPDKIVLGDKVIFPGKIRRWEQTVQLPKVPINVYTIKVSTSYGEGRTVDEYKTIIVFPYRITLVVLGVLFLLLVSLKLRKRLTKAVRILFSR